MNLDPTSLNHFDLATSLEENLSNAQANGKAFLTISPRVIHHIADLLRTPPVMSNSGHANIYKRTRKDGSLQYEAAIKVDGRKVNVYTGPSLETAIAKRDEAMKVKQQPVVASSPEVAHV